MTKLKNSKGEKTQKLNNKKNSKTLIVKELKTPIVKMKRKEKSTYDQTQKARKLKNSNCTKTQKIK